MNGTINITCGIKVLLQIEKEINLSALRIYSIRELGNRTHSWRSQKWVRIAINLAREGMEMGLNYTKENR